MIWLILYIVSVIVAFLLIAGFNDDEVFTGQCKIISPAYALLGPLLILFAILIGIIGYLFESYQNIKDKLILKYLKKKHFKKNDK